VERPGFFLSVAKWVAFWVASVPIIVAALVATLFSRRAAYRVGQFWGRLALDIFGVKLEVRHHDPAYAQGPYVFCQMNQTSLIEGVLVPAIIPVPHVSFVSLGFALIPFLGWIAVAGGVLVVRQWPAQRQRAGQRGNAEVRRGKSFFISIEGARSEGPGLLPYKKGPVVMALETKAPLVPVYLYGAREVWPWGDWRVRPGKVRAEFGAPISLQGRTLNDRDAIVAELRAEAERVLSAG
jgi:1-acyl-sn-glycerol-3-phosphate acyltransferase